LQKEVPPFVGPLAWSGSLLGPVPSVARSSPVQSGRSIGPRSGCSVLGPVGCSVLGPVALVAWSPRSGRLLGPRSGRSIGPRSGCSGCSVRSIARSVARSSVRSVHRSSVRSSVRSVNLLWLLLTSQEHLPVSFSSSSFLLIVFFCLLFISCPAHAYLSPLFSCCSIWYFLDLNYHLTNSWSCILYHL